MPTGPVKTPEDEAAINKRIVDTANARKLTFVSLVWHPWAIDTFDPDLRMLRALFQHVREQRMPTTTYAGLHAQLAGA